MNTAKKDAEIENAAICAPVNDPSRKKRIGSIGALTRISISTNEISAMAATESSATIAVLVQPWSLPRSSASTSRNRPVVSVACPGQSIPCVCGSRDSCT